MKEKTLLRGLVKILVCMTLVMGIVAATENKAYCWGPNGNPQTAITAIKEWGASEADLFADIQKGYYYDYEIQEIINAGYLGGYVSQIQALGYNVTPAGQQTPAPAPEPEPAQPAAQNQSTSSGTSQNQPAKEETTEDDSVTGTYVVIKEVSIKETFEDDAKEISVLKVGTEVKVLAQTSNKMYKINVKDITGYVPEDCLATKEQYDTAWKEIDKKEATCTSKGQVKMKNSLSGEEKTEDIDKLKHECEWKTVSEASFFSDGKKEYICKNCNEVIETEAIPATCPVPLWGVIVFAVIIVAVVVIVIIALKRKRNMESE